MQLPEGKTGLLAGAAIAATAAGAAAYVYSSKARFEQGVVVFLDGSKSGIHVDKCESIDDLKAQVEEKLHITDCRLFIEQVMLLVGRYNTTAWGAAVSLYSHLPGACIGRAVLRL
jgi:hypothetical protein